MNKLPKVISNAIKDNVSDIYITGGHPMVSRRQGKIQFHDGIQWSHQEVDELVRQLLNKRQLEALRERKSFDFSISISHARLRINFFTTMRGLSLAIRILSGHIPTIEELNLHPSLHEISRLKSGLVLICGATGVGKTATITAIINDINISRSAHIITLENPVEYRFQSNKAFIQQRELGTHMPSFAQGILDVLRENPDVIVVGEMRDAETMELTLNAAESGHLVIATMHATNPEEAIYRICSAAPAESQNEIRYQLASTLNWLVMQQLVHLEKTGYRVPLLTIMRGTSSIKNLIRENKLNQINSAIQMGKNEGMFTSERYLNEYLETCKNFTPYAAIFKPSPETSEDSIYASPLVEDDDVFEAATPKRLPPKPAKESIVVHTGYHYNEMEQMLTIDEDASLEELIKKLER